MSIDIYCTLCNDNLYDCPKCLEDDNIMIPLSVIRDTGLLNSEEISSLNIVTDSNDTMLSYCEDFETLLIKKYSSSKSKNNSEKQKVFEEVCKCINERLNDRTRYMTIRDYLSALISHEYPDDYQHVDLIEFHNIIKNNDKSEGNANDVATKIFEEYLPMIPGIISDNKKREEEYNKTKALLDEYLGIEFEENEIKDLMNTKLYINSLHDYNNYNAMKEHLSQKETQQNYKAKVEKQKKKKSIKEYISQYSINEYYNNAVCDIIDGYNQDVMNEDMFKDKINQIDRTSKKYEILCEKIKNNIQSYDLVRDSDMDTIIRKTITKIMRNLVVLEYINNEENDAIPQLVNELIESTLDKLLVSSTNKNIEELESK